MKEGKKENQNRWGFKACALILHMKLIPMIDWKKSQYFSNKNFCKTIIKKWFNGKLGRKGIHFYRNCGAVSVEEYNRVI